MPDLDRLRTPFALTMSLIQPIAGLCPAPGRAADVIAPPYDVLSSEEARERAKGRPWSFLHVSKAEIDLPPETSPYAPEVYATAAANLRRMLHEGVLERDRRPCYYAYRIEAGRHVQTGLVAGASIAAYDGGRIKRHELTRPDKEDDRVRQIEALNAQTGPVMAAYPSSAEADRLIARAAAGAPLADAQGEAGTRHTVWRIAEPEAIAALTRAFEALPALYIADGHHRSAAASRVAAARRAQRAGGRAGSGGAAPTARAAPETRPGTGAPEPADQLFLCVVFPHRELAILDYNRVVTDLAGLSEAELLERLRERFAVAPSSQPVRPARSGEFGMYCAGRWHRLTLRPELVPADPIGRLDVSLLTDHVLAPILKVGDPRTDKRIDFVGGARGLGELERRVRSGEMAAAFALYPTQLADLMAVSDAGQVMPPKSTWFEPKLADGLVSHVLD